LDLCDDLVVDFLPPNFHPRNLQIQHPPCPEETYGTRSAWPGGAIRPNTF
jgi:hypothetical protein